VSSRFARAALHSCDVFRRELDSGRSWEGEEGDRLAVVTLGTGIGGGVVINGEVLSGRIEPGETHAPE
jgi:hypothetical protein